MPSWMQVTWTSRHSTSRGSWPLCQTGSSAWRARWVCSPIGGAVWKGGGGQYAACTDAAARGSWQHSARQDQAPGEPGGRRMDVFAQARSPLYRVSHAGSQLPRCAVPVMCWLWLYCAALFGLISCLQKVKHCHAVCCCCVLLLCVLLLCVLLLAGCCEEGGAGEWH